MLRLVFWIGMVTAFAPHEPAIFPICEISVSEKAASSSTCFGQARDFEQLPLIAEWRALLREAIPRLKAQFELLNYQHGEGII